MIYLNVLIFSYVGNSQHFSALLEHIDHFNCKYAIRGLASYDATLAHDTTIHSHSFNHWYQVS